MSLSKNLKKGIIALMTIALIATTVMVFNTQKAEAAAGDKYTVTFNPNGGQGGPEPQTVEEGAYAVKPDASTDPIRAGYEFLGWGQDDDSTFEFGRTPIMGDLTLQANWAPKEVTVVFDSDGGTAVESQTVGYMKTATEPAAPTKEGFEFVRWDRIMEGYQDAKFDFREMLTENTYLTAIWKKPGEEVAPVAPVEDPKAPGKAGTVKPVTAAAKNMAKTPATGDASNTAVALTLLALAAGGMVVAGRKLKAEK